MRLLSIIVRSMPGIREPFRLVEGHLRPGVNLIVGPNGVGKSSLCRAARALLWPEQEDSTALDVEATWEIRGRTLTARRTPGRGSRWSEGGQPVDPPELPPPDLARCYSIGVLELIKPGLQGETDRRLQEELRRALSGGFDLQEVERHFMAEPQAGRREKREFEEKRRRVEQLRARFAALEEEERRLDDLRRDLERARAASRRLPLLETARDLARARRDLDLWREKMNREFPEGMEAIRGDEIGALETLRRSRDEAREQLRITREELRRAEQELAASGLEGEAPDSAEIGEQRSRLQRLAALSQSLTDTEKEISGAERERRELRQALAGSVTFEGAEALDATALDRIGEWLRRRTETRARRENLRESEALLPEPWPPGWRWTGGLALLGLLALGVWLTGVMLFAAVVALLLCAAGAAWIALDIQRARSRRLLEARRREADSRWQELAREREELQRRFGLDLGAGDLELATLAPRLQRWQQAGATLARLEGEREALAGKRDELLAQLGEFLDRWPGPRCGSDLDGVQAAFDDLVARSEACNEALRDRQEAERAEARWRERLEELSKAESEIFEKAGLPPGSDEELTRRAGLREEYRKQVEIGHRLEGEIEGLRRRLGGEQTPAEGTIEDLEEEIERLGEQAGRVDTLQEEVAGIEARVLQARSGDEMARALAERERARRAVEEIARKHLVRAAGRVLMRRVGRRHAQVAEPRVLSRAAALLAEFTHHAYALTADPESGEFRLREGATGEMLRLEALSDGTRAQTLLAARLAFAFEAERDDPVPLWLDEALTAADPERFTAIAESLVTLAGRQGRQVFYLTADPADIAQWQALLDQGGEPAAEVVDLGRLRRGQATTPTAWKAPPPFHAVDPAGMTADEYGEAIAVPPVDPLAPVEAVALFHLLRDDLTLLARLLEARIETAGHWNNYRRRRVGTLVVSEGEARRLDASVDAADGFLRNWRVGRPPRVDERALAGSGLLSERFLEEAIDLAAGLEGDGRRLIEALRGGALKRFQQKIADRLEEYFLEQGLLDPRPPLDLTALRIAVLEQIKPRIVAEEITRARVEAIVDHLWHQASKGWLSARASSSR